MTHARNRFKDEQDTEKLVLDGETLKIEDVVQVMKNRCVVSLSQEAKKKLRESRKRVEMIVKEHVVTYGIQTGFGKLCNVRIEDHELEKLQENLIKSHASGYGEPLPPEIVRGMMLIRANTFAKGYSGVRLKVVENLLTLLNSDVVPFVPRYGSLGASGDLAPLAHVALLLLGRGQAFIKDEDAHYRLVKGREALSKVGVEPLKLKAKEGLALINGTPLMASLGCFAVEEGRKLLRWATVVAAMSMEALLGTDSCFKEEIMALRPHPGAMRVAKWLREYLKGSKIRASHLCCPRVQDPYSLRCTPQVLGAVYDVIENAAKVFEIEINSVTDNPIILKDKEGRARALSGGNFHGEPLAFQLDFLGIALSEVGSLSERRINLLLDNEIEFLPEFLIEHNGLNSGFMLAHYTAAALVSRNRSLANPSSTDTIPTSANQEDHVSMGANAGLKLLEIIENLKGILSIELLCSAQALDFHNYDSSPEITKLRESYRKVVPFIEKDVEIYKLIEKTSGFMEKYTI